MEVPLEEMPQPARRCIESLMETMKARCSIEGKVKRAELIAKFFSALPFPWLMEKQVGSDGDWVYDQLHRGDDWVAETADMLYEEALLTRREALRAQLCSSISKDLPPDYAPSAVEVEETRVMALDSAQSVADTFNMNLKKWIMEVQSEWWEAHGGSFVGLDRLMLLKLVRVKIEHYDAWKVPQIAVTEFAREWTGMVGAFWAVNSGEAEIECLILPETASDPGRDTPIICETFAGQWFPRDEAIALSHQHINCVHHPAQSRVKSGSLPMFFAIGMAKWVADDLPDC